MRALCALAARLCNALLGEPFGGLSLGPEPVAET
jgi:hypothetical protein